MKTKLVRNLSLFVQLNLAMQGNLKWVVNVENIEKELVTAFC